MIGGGAERVTLNLFNAFTALGHNPYIFLVENKIEHNILDIPDDKLYWLTNNNTVIRNKLLNKLALAWKLRSIIQRISSKQNKKFSFFISSSEDMDRLSRIARIPNTYIRYRNSMSYYLNSKIGPHNNIKAKYRKWRFTRKFRSIYGNRDIVTVSNALHDDIINKVGVRPRSIVTIYNPFDFEWIYNQAQEDIDIPFNPYILYVARFQNRKRHDVLIHAFSKINTSHFLVLMGGAYTDSDNNELLMLKNIAKDMGIIERVIFLDFQINPYPWIKNASLFAMSSDSEGLPTVLIESLILGTPVVSTDCPTGPSEILTGELARYLSPTGDVDALASNITDALEHYPAIDNEIINKFNHIVVANQYIEHTTKTA